MMINRLNATYIFFAIKKYLIHLIFVTINKQGKHAP